MDLTKHKGSGGDWLRAGIYTGRVAKMEHIESQKKHTKGVELFFVDDESNKRAKGRYWMENQDGTESKALWRLEQVADAIGLSDEQMRTFELPMLKGGKCAFVVQLQSGQTKFHEVGEVAPVDEKDTLKVPKREIPKAYTPPADEFDGGDFAPFDAGANDTTDGF